MSRSESFLVPNKSNISCNSNFIGASYCKTYSHSYHVLSHFNRAELNVMYVQPVVLVPLLN